ncbi:MULTISPECIES: peptidoglycan DD-metalloendopeptidase family protein [unclassified Acidovorax]|uniref:peptidoglycan DD-metalloendopeptidase family protein n=1 Tax=unclassified Acidovorax TaxID=2684926 RepID=UPI000BCAB561|nr:MULTISPECIES: peptidoglycan DD-metalloendopeptidase family protein [unclassified Acidovorax]OZA58628.1 MAG: peptidase [Acidovorax sp. 17-64-282]HQS22149.1 peptidoglycan DD-metalloendopeptidase family protein [Acidovorax defluvii]OYY26842.1 MAG: peptidase [Acidovorax sp. 35-64-16]OYY85737.1 MAG: peptidase [Acidovorax sp. 28-64-14]OYZ45106.1 MAG: peptidase [Acidovorax sp. 16-64-162]
MLVSRSLVVGVSVTLTALVLAGCGTRMTKAPVEDRGTSSASSSPSSVPGVVVTPIKPLPGAENAGKPGYYTVKAGDTLIRIGLENGQGWKDIARWNNLDNANLIEVGQVLRVAPPSATAATETGVVARPVASSAVVPASAASTPKPAASAAVAVPAPIPATTPAAAAASSEDDVPFIWPASGTLLAGFDEARNKGYDISGKAGDPVLAAADGRVVYAGAGLRGYGNLVILKHNNTFLTAYAHNQALLVKEDQTVRRGQKIAEMGSTDADRVKLHFEIRRQGKPVDPVRYLPAR